MTHCWEDDLCAENQPRYPRGRRVTDPLKGQSEGRKVAGQTLRMKKQQVTGGSSLRMVGRHRPDGTHLADLSIYPHERKGTHGQSQHHL